MPARMGRLSNGVGRRHSVIMQSVLLIAVSLIAMSMMLVYILQHQTGAQYSAVEYTRAKAAVQ